MEEAAKRFSEIVISMTGDWLYHVSCDGIEELIKAGSYFLVYFGQVEDLYGGKMDHLKKVIAHDRFTFFDQRVEFFFNTDKECAEKRQFNPEEPAIALYVHEDIPPFTLTKQEDLVYEHLIIWISTSIVESNLQWGSRAQYLIFEQQIGALVYLVPSIEEEKSDWKTDYIMTGSIFLRERRSQVVSIIAPFH